MTAHEPWTVISSASISQASSNTSTRKSQPASSWWIGCLLVEVTVTCPEYGQDQWALLISFPAAVTINEKTRTMALSFRACTSLTFSACYQHHSHTQKVQQHDYGNMLVKKDISPAFKSTTQHPGGVTTLHKVKDKLYRDSLRERPLVFPALRGHSLHILLLHKAHAKDTQNPLIQACPILVQKSRSQAGIPTTPALLTAD